MSDRTEGRVTRGRRRRFDTDDVLNAAMGLFWERGYEATSVSALCTRMGINPPSLYAAFGSKADLFLTVVDQYERTFWDPVWQVFDEEPDAHEAFRSFFESAVAVVSAPGGHQGCLVTLSAAGLEDRGNQVGRALGQIGQDAVSRMKAKLDANIRNKKIPADTDTLALAHALNAIFDGLALRASEGLSADLLRRLASTALDMIPVSR